MRNLISAVLMLPLCAQAADRVEAGFSVHGSSEPVSISDMVSGWDGAFTPGRYAYADARMGAALTLDDWTVRIERRWYYYFTFSRGMSVFYRNQEQGLDSASDYDLSLDALGFYAEGGVLSHPLSFADVTVTPSVGLYRVYDYQFGELDGVSAAGSDVSASATLDYHFSEDKILDYPVDVPAGTGFTAGVEVAFTGLRDWQMSLTLSDLLNRWQLPDAGFTTGCINLGSSAGEVCSSSGAASGRSGTGDYSTRIPVTVDAQVVYTPYAVRAQVYQHGLYRRLSVQKDWQTGVGALGVSLHSTHQLGLHWQGQFGRLSLLSDDQRLHYARDLQLDAALSWSW
ncbi:hypothetical protein ACQUQU_06270 [Thalassolituus sp. LLYu03]|uniref:hypothetical protein n=1 Tax=Thalassolituus sp. LLYu03 TaxID=3421656 RepID=UPI003D2A4AFD